MKKILLFILILSLFTFSAVADNYSEIGNNNDFRFEGVSFFNTELGSVNQASVSIDTNFIPLAVDLDGDGSIEIVVFDGDDIAIYNFSTNLGLQLRDSLDTDLDASENMFMMTQDIDGDGFQEIIAVSDATTIIEIFEYNTTGILRRQEQFSVGSSSGERMVACNSANLCVVVRSEQDETGVGNDLLRATFFNATNVGITAHVIESASGESFTSILCMARVRNIEVEDVDGDGLEDFTVSIGKLRPSGLEEFKVARFTGVHSNLSFDTSVVLSNVQTTVDLTSGTTCEAINVFMSAPLVMNVNGGGDLETIMGVGISSNDFVMFTIATDGDTERFPNILLGNSEGTIISNPFRMNAFDDSPNTANPSAVDFCILGHDAAGNTLDLLCASKLRTGFFSADSTDYEFDVEVGFILPEDNSVDYVPMAHSGEFQDFKGEGMDANLDELVSTYGIFRLNNPTVGFDFLDKQFQNPITNASVIMVDLEGNGRNQMVMCSETNLIVLNDRFVNTGGRIVDPSTIKPCPNTTWKLSTENDTNLVFISFTVDDLDGDDVSARATIYAGEAINRTTNFTANFSAGTTFSFSFEINETTPSSIMRLEGRDVENPDVIDVIEFQFDVATEGITSRECVFDLGLGDLNDVLAGETAEERATRLAQEESFQDDLAGSRTDNAFRNFLGTLQDLTGIGITVWWLLIIVIIVVMIVLSETCPREAMIPIILILFGVWIITGAFLGFIGVGTVIALVIISLLVIIVLALRPIAGGG